MDFNKTIREFIQQNLIVFEDDATFSDSDNIFERGFVNSLFAIQLLNFVQREFDIVIENEDIDIKNFSSVNNIAQLVQKKQKGE